VRILEKLIEKLNKVQMSQSPCFTVVAATAVVFRCSRLPDVFTDSIA